MDTKAILVIGGAVVVTGGVFVFTPPQLNPDAGLTPAPETPVTTPEPIVTDSSSSSSGTGSTSGNNNGTASTPKSRKTKDSNGSAIITNIEIDSEDDSETNSSQSPTAKPSATSSQSVSSPKASSTPTPTPTPKPTPTPTPTPKPTPTPTPTPVKQTVNGTFTGDAVNVSYGIVQVRITVTNSKITDAQAIQSPTGGKSGSISASSIPILRQETLAAQSAAIRGVSGASFTSNGWIRSLTTAIARAGI